MFNDKPLEDFSGFSPSQMHQMIYYPFGENCPIKLSEDFDIKYLKLSPVFNIALALMKIIDESKEVKLTAKGNLPGKIIKDIYSKGFFPDEMIDKGLIKLRLEIDWLILHCTHLLLKLSGILKKNHDKLVLTKKGVKFLNDPNKTVMFISLLENYSMKFNWAYNDGFSNEDIGQIGFLYLLFVINNANSGFKRVSNFIDVYFKAFPMFLNKMNPEFENPEFVVSTRFFDRFAKWFGFIEYEIDDKLIHLSQNFKIRKTELLGKLFS
jgi:hypothetical protein